MPRLPVVLSDLATWGQILNTYLSQEHGAAGLHLSNNYGHGVAGGRFAQQFPVLAELHNDGCTWTSLLTTMAQAGLLNMPPSVSALPEATSGMISAAQAAITAAPASSDVDLTTVVGAGPGKYRTTFTGPANIRVRILGRGQISVLGSDNWSPGGAAGCTWSVSGSNFRSSLSLATLAVSETVSVGADIPALAGGTYLFDAQNRHMVWLDNVPQRRVSAASTLAAGQWKTVSDTSFGYGSQIILFGNPAGHTVEVTARDAWATVLASGTVFDGIDFRHSPSTNNTSLPLNGAGFTTTIQHCMVGDTHGSAISQGSVPLIVRDSIIHDCGVAGIQTYQSDASYIGRNLIYNTAGAKRFSGDVFDWAGYDHGFGSGGVKLAGVHGCLLDGNWVWNCGFSGLWTDIVGTYGVRFTANKVWDYQAYGIHFEISDGGEIDRNIIFRTNADPWNRLGNPFTNNTIGIYSSTSRQVDIHHNLLMRNGIGIYTRWDGTRTGPPGGFKRVVLSENRIYARRGGGGTASDLFWAWTDSVGDGSLISDASNLGYNNYYGSLSTIVSDAPSWIDDYQWYSDLGSLPGQDVSKYFLNIAAVIQSRWENGNSALPGGGTTLTRMLKPAEVDVLLVQWGHPGGN